MAKAPRHVGWQVLAFLGGGILGIVYLRLIYVALDLLWSTVPDLLGSLPIICGYTVVLLVGGAAAVGWLRARSSVFGHSPLDGLAVRPDPVRVSLISFTAVVITLLSGAVLGPEAGLLALGSAVGMAIAGAANLSGAEGPLVTAGALGGIVGLFVNMLAGSTIRITDETTVAWIDIAWSVPVAVAAGLVMVAVRLPAYRLRDWADPRPTSVRRVALSGLLVAVVAVVGYAMTQDDPRLILGSGEGYIGQVIGITSMSTLLVILIAKAIAYSLCLGGGLRGGPIFPAMFLGAATSAIFVNLGVPADTAALAAGGISAAFCVGLKLPTLGLIVAAVGTGILLGSWWLIGPTIVGVLVGKLVATALQRLPGVGPVPDPVDESPATAQPSS